MNSQKIIWMLCAVSIMLLTALSSIALSPKEEKLMTLAQKACSGYFSVNNLKLSVKEIQQKAKKRKAVIEKVMNYALNADSLKSQEPLLRHMLMTKGVRFHIWNYIAINKKNIPKKNYKLIIRWVVESLDIAEFKPAVAGIIKGLIITFDNPEYYDQHSLKILEKIVLTDVNVGSVYISFFKDFTPAMKKKLLKMTKRVNVSETRRSKWVNRWISACVLARAQLDNMENKLPKLATEVLKKNKKKYVLMYVPLGLAFSENKLSIQLLFEFLNSDYAIKIGKNTYPPVRSLSHEAACALSLIVKDFPKITPYQKYTNKEKKKCIEWTEKHKDSYKITKHPLSFYLKYTSLGL